MALDGVPIDIRDGLLEPRRFCLGRCWVSGCPGLESALGAVKMLLVPLEVLGYAGGQENAACPTKLKDLPGIW